MQIVLAITLIEDKPQDIVHSSEGISSLRKARKCVVCPRAEFEYRSMTLDTCKLV